MEYKYYNQFNLSNELSQTISSIISKKEKEPYVCKIITLTIPEREGLIFQSPLTDEMICRPGVSALSGAQIQAINEKYGKYVTGTIPEESYPFFIVIKVSELEKILSLSFMDKTNIKQTLQKHSIICQEYYGTFDSRTLIKKFPYLQYFFNYLDEWRAENGRVTIDNNILESGKKKVLK